MGRTRCCQRARLKPALGLSDASVREASPWSFLELGPPAPGPRPLGPRPSALGPSAPGPRPSAPRPPAPGPRPSAPGASDWMRTRRAGRWGLKGVKRASEERRAGSGPVLWNGVIGDDRGLARLMRNSFEDRSTGQGRWERERRPASWGSEHTQLEGGIGTQAAAMPLDERVGARIASPTSMMNGDSPTGRAARPPLNWGAAFVHGFRESASLAGWSSAGVLSFLMLCLLGLAAAGSPGPSDSDSYADARRPVPEVCGSQGDESSLQGPSQGPRAGGEWWLPEEEDERGEAGAVVSDLWYAPARASVWRRSLWMRPRAFGRDGDLGSPRGPPVRA